VEKLILEIRAPVLTQRREDAEAQRRKKEGERVKKMESKKWDLNELPTWQPGFGREGALGRLEVPADR
jgi:hypothetical protein